MGAGFGAPPPKVDGAAPNAPGVGAPNGDAPPCVVDEAIPPPNGLPAGPAVAPNGLGFVAGGRFTPKVEFCGVAPNPKDIAWDTAKKVRKGTALPGEIPFFYLQRYESTKVLL